MELQEDLITYLVWNICQDHERVGFIRGIQTGFWLCDELSQSKDWECLTQKQKNKLEMKFL